MIIAVCDPKGIAIEAIKTILYHDKGLSDRISRIRTIAILVLRRAVGSLFLKLCRLAR